MRGGFEQSRKNTTDVKPTGTELAEDMAPVIVSGFELQTERLVPTEIEIALVATKA